MLEPFNPAAGRQEREKRTFMPCTTAPGTLVALYGSDFLHTLEDLLIMLSSRSDLEVTLKRTLRTDTDSLEYSMQLLQNTWVAWPDGAPELPVTFSLQHRSSQGEVGSWQLALDFLANQF